MHGLQQIIYANEKAQKDAERSFAKWKHLKRGEQAFERAVQHQLTRVTGYKPEAALTRFGA